MSFRNKHGTVENDKVDVEACGNRGVDCDTFEQTAKGGGPGLKQDGWDEDGKPNIDAITGAVDCHDNSVCDMDLDGGKNCAFDSIIKQKNNDANTLIKK